MKKILMLAFLQLSVQPPICAEGRWVQPPSAAQAPQPSPSEVEQSFFKNLTREHCEENSKWGSGDELLKRKGNLVTTSQKIGIITTRKEGNCHRSGGNPAAIRVCVRDCRGSSAGRATHS